MECRQKCRFGLLIGLVVLAGAASASPITAGYNLFESQPGAQLVTPFGLLQFRSVPISIDEFGTTNVILQRTGSLPDGGIGAIPVELVALSLVSTAPVTVDLGGGPAAYDVWAIMNAIGSSGITQTLALPASTGSIFVDTHTDPLGGHLFFDLPSTFVEIQLRPAGDPSTVAFAQQREILGLFGTSNWTHAPPFAYPLNPLVASGGMHFDTLLSNGTDEMLLVSAQAPEPASVGMIGLGLGIAICALRRRARSAAARTTGA